MAGKCRVCGAPAYARLEYANLQLCRDDFVRFFERRVERTVERYGMFERGSRVAVAVSGGKDSVALLHSLWKLRGKLGVELVAITIDLGIAGHSDRYVPLARRVCERLGVPCRVVDLRGEYGFSVDELRGLRRPVCSLCGAVKRYVLNREARELGAHVLATGHNLDDFLAALLQAYIRGDLKALAKLRPYLPPEGKLVARAKPLVETPERDTKLYVEALGLEHVTWKCPYSSGASSFEYKRVLDLLEEEHPSIKFQMLRSFLERIQPLISVEEPSLLSCSKCGEPSSSPVCQFCRIKSMIAKLETNEARLTSSRRRGPGFERAASPLGSSQTSPR
jgi:uncharacterized protein (TIGR00269 family)